jgi:hypothetical protein
MEPMHKTTKLLIALVVLNALAIGTGEVQRRSLIDKAIAFQNFNSAKLDKLIADNDKNTQFALNGVKTSVDEVTRSLSTRVDALLQLYGIKLDQPADDPAKRDAERAYHATLLKSALRIYRREHGAFPALPTGSVAGLKAALVGGGYLEAIPKDPSGRDYQYTVDGAKDLQRYGLMVPLESGDCLTGSGAEKTGWFNSISMCPF